MNVNKRNVGEEPGTSFAQSRLPLPQRVRVVGLLALVAGCIAVLVARDRPALMDPQQTREQSAEMLRAALRAESHSGTQPHTLYRIREGIERFFITDINNPGGSAYARTADRHARRHRSESQVVYNAPAYAAPASTMPAPVATHVFPGERYDFNPVNTFTDPHAEPLSTFAIDVDTASYTNVRRMLRQGLLPPAEAVRVEEFINYFDYNYPAPTGDAPFAVSTEVTNAPWRPENRLVRVGLRARELDTEERPALNVVFLIDVSGSMSDQNKLPLVQEGLMRLAGKLDSRDRVGIVTYANSAHVVLPPTNGADRHTILGAIGALRPGGGTNGAGGIQLAYDEAQRYFCDACENRVILCTDGDFNVGITDRDTLVNYIQERASAGVFLSVYGFGMGNLKDGMLEQLADNGNGVYGYIDTPREAHRAFVEKFGGGLFTIAKDVKLQVEFNPKTVAQYRLIGYENRMLAAEDFNDDRVDAGEMGAGHRVTALYEIVPNYAVPGARKVDALRYGGRPAKPEGVPAQELCYVKIRYKAPDGHRSQRFSHPVHDRGDTLDSATADTRFAAAVAWFGNALRHQGIRHREAEKIRSLATSGITWGDETHAEFVQLVESAAALSRNPIPR